MTTYPPNALSAQAAAEARQLGHSLVAAAQQEVGRAESRFDNHGAAIRRYQSTVGIGVGAPWCAAFASYIAQAVAPGLIRPSALANGIQDQFVQHRAFRSFGSGYRPQEGDLIFFQRGGAREEWRGHVGFVVGFDRQGRLVTIEGNKHDPFYGNQVEGRDYRWSPMRPDAVRRVTYTREELVSERALGYGSLAAFVAARSYHPAPPEPAQDNALILRLNSGHVRLPQLRH